MSRIADAMTDGPAAAVVAGAFVVLATFAWLVSPGLSVALACYGAGLVSERVHDLVHAPATRRRRSLAMLGVALAWLVALACAALVLPSNFSVAVI